MKKLFEEKHVFHFLPHPAAIDRLALRDPNLKRRRYYFESQLLMYQFSDDATRDFDKERKHGVKVREALKKQIKEANKYKKKKKKSKSKKKIVKRKTRTLVR